MQVLRNTYERVCHTLMIFTITSQEKPPNVCSFRGDLLNLEHILSEFNGLSFKILPNDESLKKIAKK